MRRIVIAVLMLGASTAVADEELWLTFEQHLPAEETVLAARIAADVRFETRADGIAFSAFRAGPLWRPRPWFTSSLVLVGIGERDENDGYLQEYRLEVDPTFTLELGAVRLVNRHRVDVIYAEGDWAPRYRNRLMVGGDGDGPASPFASVEGLWRLSSGALYQVRVQLGLQRRLGEHRLGLAWMAIVEPFGSRDLRNVLLVALTPD